MPGIQIGTSRPPEDSPAFDELYRMSAGRNRVRRWTGRPCDQLPGGMQFLQLDRGDQRRYEQAGCSFLGSQPARRSLVVGGSMVGSAPQTTWIDTWCCQPDQVVPVFEQWVQSDEYERKGNLGLIFAGALIVGVGLLFMYRKQLGATMGGERTQRVSWAANPDLWDEDDWEDEE